MLDSPPNRVLHQPARSRVLPFVALHLTRNHYIHSDTFTDYAMHSVLKQPFCPSFSLDWPIITISLLFSFWNFPFPFVRTLVLSSRDNVPLEMLLSLNFESEMVCMRGFTPIFKGAFIDCLTVDNHSTSSLPFLLFSLFVCILQEAHPYYIVKNSFYY